MILRIKIVTPEYINDTLCGNSLQLLDTDIVVNVNGIEVLNYTSGSALQYHEISIPTIATWDENIVDISCSLTGYETYHNIFTVYGYDLGDSGSPSNYPFEIIMIQDDYRTVLQQTELIDDGFGNMIANPDYIPQPIRLIYGDVIAYRKPFTNEIHFYKNVNIGNVSYISSSTGETFSSTGNGVICSSDNFGIIPYYTLFGFDNTGCCSPTQILLDECIGAEVIVNAKTWIPNTGYNYISENCDTSCINNIDKNKAILEIDFSVVDCLYVDDTLVAPFVDLYVNQELWGIGSSVVNNIIKGYVKDSNLINIGDYVSFQNPITVTDNNYGFGNLFRYIWEFDTPDIGDYILSSTVFYDGYVGQTVNQISPEEESVLNFKEYGVLYCTHLDTITSCNWYEIRQIECNKYKVYNHSFDEVILNIYKLNVSNEFILDTTSTIGECNEVDIQVTTDGIYKFEVVRNTRTYTYIVINYCAIQDCYLNYLKNNICCDAETRCNTENVYDYNVFNSMVSLLLAQLNSEYNFNYIYEFISEEKLSELYDINTIINRINTEYCVNCNTPNGCNDIVSSNCTSCN